MLAYLRIAIECGLRSSENPGKVLETHPRGGSCIEASDVSPDRARTDGNPREHLEQVRQLGPERETPLRALVNCFVESSRSGRSASGALPAA